MTGTPPTPRFGTRVALHVRQLWPGPGVLLPLPFVVWAGVWLIAGQGRVEHALILVLVPLLAFVSAASKRLFLGLYPMGILGLVYDTMRLVQNVGVTEERVHVCDLRAIDMRIASAEVGGVRGTVHDWVQAHPSRTLEVIAAVPYGMFLFAMIGFAVYLYVKDYARMRLFGWGFLLVNLAGFVTYHVYPAAPPWYFHQYGCRVDLGAIASEGPSLARVDAWLGVHYFREMYGRASDVYGAVPSLHAAYPLLLLLFGWPILRWPGRALALAFLVSMCGAAVWLDHHWIVDIVVGLVYALTVFALLTTFARSRSPALVAIS